MPSRKQEHIEQIAEWCLIAQKNFSFKVRAERDWKYWCKRRQRVNRHFAAPSAWVFVFLICVKKTISMKILLLRVINSSRHRNCFVRGYIHSLFVSKALTRSYHSFGFSHKQLVNTTPFAALSMTWTIFTSGPTSLSLTISTSPPPGKARTYELLKIGSFKFPTPQAKMVFKCPNPIDGFVCKLLPSFAVSGDINSRRKTILDAGYAVRCTRKDIN